MGLLDKLFKRAPERPFLEYPDDHLENFQQALAEGIRRYRAQGKGRRIVISMQGMGGRVDSYRIVDVHLQDRFLDFSSEEVDLEKICALEGLDYSRVKGRTATELNIGGLSDEEVARFLEAMFTKHLGVPAFSDSGDYCVGFEYDDDVAQT